MVQTEPYLLFATPAMAQGQEAVVDACRSLKARAGAVCFAHKCYQGLESIEHDRCIRRGQQGAQVLHIITKPLLASEGASHCIMQSSGRDHNFNLLYHRAF